MSRFAVRVVAFGYAAGAPPEAELVVDVRFLSNPNYVDALRPLTGADAPVAAFMERLPEVRPLLEHLFALVDYLIPLYARVKPRVTLAIGCTGGRHRSVYVAERLAEHVRSLPGTAVSLSYRDLTAA